jgi:hypothetical protein
MSFRFRIFAMLGGWGEKPFQDRMLMTRRKLGMMGKDIFCAALSITRFMKKLRVRFHWKDALPRVRFNEIALRLK